MTCILALVQKKKLWTGSPGLNVSLSRKAQISVSAARHFARSTQAVSHRTPASSKHGVHTTAKPGGAHTVQVLRRRQVTDLQICPEAHLHPRGHRVFSYVNR